MEQKNLIIGGFTNYNINQLKPWVISAKKVAGNNDVVLIYGNATTDTLDWLTKQGIILVPMLQSNGVPIHVMRFLSIYAYLKNHWKEYQYVVTTDVKDVYFQSSPFEWLDKNLAFDKKLVAGSESMKYKNEPWGNENLMQTYGEYIYNLFKDNEIYCVGTIGGTSEYVRDLVFNIFSNATNRPIPIVDQAVFNVLIQTQPFKDVILFAKQYNGWTCHAGTTVDPFKIESFRPFLLEAEPTFVDGEVLTSTGELFSIVHQYDRVPEWKEFVRKKYGQEDESQLFVYRTQ